MQSRFPTNGKILENLFSVIHLTWHQKERFEGVRRAIEIKKGKGMLISAGIDNPLERGPNALRKITRSLTGPGLSRLDTFKVADDFDARSHRESPIFDVKLHTFIGDTITGPCEGGMRMQWHRVPRREKGWL